MIDGTCWAAMLLAASVTVLPATPARRLGRAPRRRVSAVSLWLAVGVPVAALAAALPSTTLLAALAGATTVLVRRRQSVRRRRAAAEGAALVAALDILVGELRIGAHPVRAFDVAAQEAPGAVGVALSGVAARARLGADVAAGLECAGVESALGAQWRRMAIAWRMAAEHGLAIGAVMRAAQADIVERQRFWTRVQAGMAGARATAAILAGLPVVGIVLGQFLGADPIAFLTGGGAGGWFLLAGVTLACTGLCWTDRIIERLPV